MKADLDSISRIASLSNTEHGSRLNVKPVTWTRPLTEHQGWREGEALLRRVA